MSRLAVTLSVAAVAFVLFFVSLWGGMFLVEAMQAKGQRFINAAEITTFVCCFLTGLTFVGSFVSLMDC